jgi:hypothetical protein
MRFAAAIQAIAHVHRAFQPAGRSSNVTANPNFAAISGQPSDKSGIRLIM